jgi:hypothetical protein
VSTRPRKPTAPEQIEARAGVPAPNIRWTETTPVANQTEGFVQLRQVKVEPPKRPGVPRLPNRN